MYCSVIIACVLGDLKKIKIKIKPKKKPKKRTKTHRIFTFLLHF